MEIRRLICRKYLKNHTSKNTHQKTHIKKHTSKNIMKKLFTATSLLLSTIAFCQFPASSNNDSWKKTYRATAPKINNVLHTKLLASFNYQQSQLNGKVYLTCSPHFYPTNVLQLDAKGMDINEVAIVKGTKKEALSYTYNDSANLIINLDKTYTAKEKYIIYIDYVAKPNELKTIGSAAITDAKGLYFINPKGEGKDKPTQIWTQGETEATSVWVPTIDRTNQKTTQEFYLTVPSKYVTLSNGKLMSQTKNNDSTRTDYWKMDLPHCPYLFFIGVGDYAIVKDSYKGKEVNYYVEKEYTNAAKKIFGQTPEMMKYFSEKITGVEFPWIKYSQIIGRDYVSGAMENTTATLHQESAQQNLRELTEGNGWESTVSHELFHQWFGDYVTAESWSNLTVNESFANYSQYLWDEYKNGPDAAGEENDREMQSYLRSNSSKKDLVRFYYADKEDMFDLVSYQKGGRILHMLRNYIGDSAFFKSLNKYLVDNKFSTGSAHKLRLAFEAITGKDLNWYFNQWYFSSGHPKLDIKNSYNAAKKTVTVYVKQTQDSAKTYQLPVAIDIYYANVAQKQRHNVMIENRNDSFEIEVKENPSLVRFDGDNVLLAEKKETKTYLEFVEQYNKAGNFLDRKEALDFAAKNKAIALPLIKQALHDKYFKIRIKAIALLIDTTVDAATIATIENIASNDAYKKTKEKAIDFLAGLKNDKYLPMFKKLVFDSSYSVAGAALDALAKQDENAATSLLPILKKDMKDRLKQAVERAELLKKGDADFDEMTKNFNKLGMQEKFTGYSNFAFYVSRLNDTEKFKKAIDMLISFRNQVIPFGASLKDILNKPILEIKTNKLKQTSTLDIQNQIKYIDEKLSE
jgi:aminopeptidase N